MSGHAYSTVTARRASNLIYEIALQSPQGVWVVPDNVCPAVPLALACAGAELRFVDIDALTLCLDVAKVAELAKTEYVVGVVYVRTYGANTPARSDLANLRNALPDAILIDDCCIGIPLTSPPEKGSVADVFLFSMGYAKALDLEGGAYGFFKKDMAFISGGNTIAPAAFEELLAIANAAFKTGEPVFSDFDFSKPEFSTKAQLPFQDWPELSQTIQEKLPNRLEHKAVLNTIYKKGLGKFAPLTDDYQNWRFHILLQNPEQTLAALLEAGLFASRHYAPVSKLWGGSPAPVSQKIAKNIINLFNDQYFTVKQAHQTVDIINKVGKPLKG